MIKHLIQKAKIKFFEAGDAGNVGDSGDAGGTLIRLPVGHLGLNPMTPPSVMRRLNAAQQRIELLEVQNQQLRADIARCKSSYIGFAHEMRRLLAE